MPSPVSSRTKTFYVIFQVKYFTFKLNLNKFLRGPRSHDLGSIRTLVTLLRPWKIALR